MGFSGPGITWLSHVTCNKAFPMEDDWMTRALGRKKKTKHPTGQLERQNIFSTQNCACRENVFIYLKGSIKGSDQYDNIPSDLQVRTSLLTLCNYKHDRVDE